MNTFSRFNFFSFLLLIFSFTTVSGQSKFTYGLGIGANSTSNFDVPVVVNNQNVTLQWDRLIGPDIFTRVNYKFNNRLRLSSGPGFSFRRVKDSGITTESVFMNIPLIAQISLIDQFYFAGGVQYEYLLNMAVKSDTDTTNINDSLDSRNFLALHLGLSYHIKDWVELSFAYKPTLNSYLDATITDINGDPAGTVKFRQNNFQIAAIMYH